MTLKVRKGDLKSNKSFPSSPNNFEGNRGIVNESVAESFYVTRGKIYDYHCSFRRARAFREK